MSTDSSLSTNEAHNTPHDPVTFKTLAETARSEQIIHFRETTILNTLW